MQTKANSDTHIFTFESAKVDTPPATSNVQAYSGKVYLIPYTNVPISMTVQKKKQKKSKL